jgi:hypothetical protein
VFRTEDAHRDADAADPYVNVTTNDLNAQAEVAAQAELPAVQVSLAVCAAALTVMSVDAEVIAGAIAAVARLLGALNTSEDCAGLHAAATTT